MLILFFINFRVMRHYRQPPQKSFFAYIVPFLILIFLGLIIFLLIRFWDNLGSSFGSETSYAVMETQSGEAKVMLWRTTDWTSVPTSKLKLFQGDAIRSLPGGRVKVELFEKHFLTLNGNSELVIKELRKENSAYHTSLELVQGEVWLNVARDINPSSTFVIKSQNFSVKTDGAVFDLEPNLVRMVKGDAKVSIYSDKELLVEQKVGVGQELVLNDVKLQGLIDKDEDLELVTMLSDEFKLSDWYLYNMEGKKIEIAMTETGENVLEENVPKEKNDKILEEKQKETTEEKFVLTKPVITTPAKDGEEFKMQTSSQKIEGTVAKGTAKVLVNDYALQSFKLGDTAWRYNVDVKYANVKQGKNLYEVYAVDEKGKKSEVAKITLVYNLEEKEAEKTVTTETTKTTETKIESEIKATTVSTEAKTTATTGELKITLPNNGEDWTTKETTISIQGTAPSNAAKIVVSGYTLTGFKLGDTAWRYTADPKYNNLTVGEKNTYNVIAYDADDKVVGSEQITITVEKTATTGTGAVTE